SSDLARPSVRTTGSGRIRSRSRRRAVRRPGDVLRENCWSLFRLRASKRWPWRPPLSESTYSAHHCVCEYVRQVHRRYPPESRVYPSGHPLRERGRAGREGRRGVPAPPPPALLLLSPSAGDAQGEGAEEDLPDLGGVLRGVGGAPGGLGDLLQGFGVHVGAEGDGDDADRAVGLVQLLQLVQ